MIDLKAVASADNTNTFILRYAAFFFSFYLFPLPFSLLLSSLLSCRLAHLFDVTEVSNATLRGPVELNMRYFFNAPYCISSLNATYLTANKGIFSFLFFSFLLFLSFLSFLLLFYFILSSFYFYILSLTLS